jgi:hypothetical protein
MTGPGGGRGSPDPQYLWLKVEDRLAEFLPTVPAERQALLRIEDLYRHPKAELRRVCAALGLPADRKAIAAMLHPEQSAFSRRGPFGAHLGDEPDFLNEPAFLAGPAEEASLEGSLPWRKDKGGFDAQVMERARGLGYD